MTKMDRRLFLLVYALTVAGIVFVFSASFAVASRHGGDGYAYLKSQSQFALAGLVLMVAVSYLPLRWLQKLAFPVFALGCALMLAAALWGHEVRGARCWIWGFQPSEFAKVAFVVYLAALFARPLHAPRHRGYETHKRVMVKATLAAAFVCGLLLLQSDQGMAMLVLAITFGMLYLGGMHRGLLTAGGLLAGGAGLIVASCKPYIWTRILAWLHPERYTDGPGLHIYSMLIALAKGHALGQGLGFSDGKWRTLPEPYNDSIFCVVGGELGLWGALLLLGGIVLLAVLAFDIARRSPSAMGWYAAAGCGMALVLQGLIHIAVTTNSIPVTGLNLPFISAGGSSLISSMMAAGIILAVSRYSSPPQRAS